MSTDKIKLINELGIKEKYKFKVVIVGDSGVGKTNLLKRFINDSFASDTKATVGVELISKTFSINNDIIKVDIWDTAGQERYKSITSSYYKGANGAMIVYDVTNKISFDNVNKWYNELMKHAKMINIIMIGNKTDLKDNIQVISDMSETKATALEIPILETSALDNSNVKEAFYQLLEEMYNTVNNNKNDNELSEDLKLQKGEHLDLGKEEKKDICCKI